MPRVSVQVGELLLVSYRQGRDAKPQIGLAQGGRIVPLSGVQGFSGDIVDACARVTGALEQLDRIESSQSIGFGDVELCPPVADPEKIICLGLNYPDHASEAGFEAPPIPVFFSKYGNALSGAFDPIVVPRSSRQIDFEGELAVVIGKPGKYIALEHALDHVAGYSVMNDVSARDLQLQTSQWTAGKTLDTFAPFGPGIVPAGLIPDPQDLRLETRLNGTVVQSDSTASMIFGVAETIVFLSSLMTLQPGDVIATGTPAGVGFKREPPLFLTPGDVVEVQIERIGTIRNPVVSEDGAGRERRGA
jgi:2-keto-4-pentenoate hydratase/2-oxohepta-3-ene-1,7-dioic acid hydratase in catechol pathway